MACCDNCDNQNWPARSSAQQVKDVEQPFWSWARELPRKATAQFTPLVAIAQRLAESHIDCASKFRSVEFWMANVRGSWPYKIRKLWSQYSCSRGKPSSFSFDICCLHTLDLARAGTQFRGALWISHALTLSHVAWHDSVSVCTLLGMTLCSTTNTQMIRTLILKSANKSMAWAFL